MNQHPIQVLKKQVEKCADIGSYCTLTMEQARKLILDYETLFTSHKDCVENCWGYSLDEDFGVENDEI